jgi:hypothetical protein
MRLALAVLFPLVAQAVFVLVIILVTNGTGSFVGLGAMVLGIFALPITALLNWLFTRAEPPHRPLPLGVRVLSASAIFPALILFLLIATS